MKIKPTKICSRKGCNNEFKIYKTTDKYCSSECAYLDAKDKPKKDITPYKLKPYSERRMKENKVYLKKRKTFLSLVSNKYCPVCKLAFEGKIDIAEFPVYNAESIIYLNQGLIETDSIHHKAGRTGKLLNYVPYWLAVSDIGHKWIHSNPEKAYEFGFLIHSSTINI